MRKKRELQLDAVYHVGARINNKEMLLKSAEIKQLFLSVVKRAKKKVCISTHKFCNNGESFPHYY